MANVEINISMSVDGFITGPDINEHPVLGRGGEILHAWLRRTTRSRSSMTTCSPAGAVITSRKVYDEAAGWGATMGSTECLCSSSPTDPRR